MQPLEAVQTLVFMSVVVESLVAVFRNFIFNGKILNLIAVVLGVTLCFAYSVGIFSTLGMETKYPVVDYFASGMIISQGSHALNELFKLRQKSIHR